MNVKNRKIKITIHLDDWVPDFDLIRSREGSKGTERGGAAGGRGEDIGETGMEVQPIGYRREEGIRVWVSKKKRRVGRGEEESGGGHGSQPQQPHYNGEEDERL